MPARPDTHGPVLLFDGVCNLCNASVQFVIDRDPEARFRFAALQSDVGRSLAASCGVDPDALDSIVLVENGACHTHSAAALRVARRLSAGWPLLSVFLAVPRPLRDAVYDFVAARRYEWFGKEEACRIPTPELRARFLDA